MCMVHVVFLNTTNLKIVRIEMLHLFTLFPMYDAGGYGVQHHFQPYFSYSILWPSVLLVKETRENQLPVTDKLIT